MKGIKHALCHRALRGALLLVLSLGGVQVAFSQALPSTPYPFPVTTAGNVRAYQGGTATAANAASFGYGNAANSPVYAQVNTTHGLPNGQSVPVQTKSFPTGPNVGKALANFARKLVPVAVAGMAIYELLEELGYRLGKDSLGNNTLEVVSPGWCGTAPCYEYKSDLTWSPASYVNAPWSLSYQGACTAQLDWMNAHPPNANTSYSGGTLSGGGTSCHIINCYLGNCNASSYGSSDTPISQREVPPQTQPSYEPATWPELEAAIAARNQIGWPVGSAVPDALRDAVASGEPLPLPDPAEVTGPASAPGPSKTSTQTNKDAQGNPTGTTTSVTNTTYNISYGPNTITTTTTNTTNITNPDGTTQTATETAQDPAPKEEPQPDQCEKYPNSAGCADLDVPVDEIPKTTKNVTFQPENLGFGGGTCPADKMVTLRGMPQPVKVFDWQDTCGKLQTYARPMILALATFAALMIIFGARVE